MYTRKKCEEFKGMILFLASCKPKRQTIFLRVLMQHGGNVYSDKRLKRPRREVLNVNLDWSCREEGAPRKPVLPYREACGTLSYLYWSFNTTAAGEKGGVLRQQEGRWTKGRLVAS